MKKDWQEYRDTEMLGAYHPENAVLKQTESGEINHYIPGHGALGQR